MLKNAQISNKPDLSPVFKCHFAIQKQDKMSSTKIVKGFVSTIWMPKQSSIRIVTVSNSNLTNFDIINVVETFAFEQKEKEENM